MLKKLAKISVVGALLAGMAVAPAFAEDKVMKKPVGPQWSGVLKGQVAAWTVMGDDRAASTTTTPDTTKAQDGDADALFTIGVKVKNGDTTAQLLMKHDIKTSNYTDRHFIFKATTKSGDWTAKAYAETEIANYDNNTATSVNERDQYVTLENKKMYFKVGTEEWLGVQIVGGSHFFREANDVHEDHFFDAGYGRQDGFAFGIKADGLKAGLFVALEQDETGKYFGASMATTLGSATTAITSQNTAYKTTDDTYALVVEYKKGKIDANFQYASQSSKGDSKRDATSDGFKGTGSQIFLSAKFDAGSIKPFLNFRQTQVKEEMGSTTNDFNWLLWELGADMSLKSSGVGISFSYTSHTYEDKDTASTKESLSMFTLGVKKKIANVTLTGGLQFTVNASDAVDKFKKDRYGFGMIYDF
ncbi:MAG: putative porin [bacterium]|jgi:predicted porin